VYGTETSNPSGLSATATLLLNRGETETNKKSVRIAALENWKRFNFKSWIFFLSFSRPDPLSLELIASEIVRSNLPLAFEILDLDVTPDSLIHFLDDVLQNFGWFTLEKNRSKVFLDFKLFHKFNQEWSLFLKHLLLNMFELVDVRPEIVISDRSEEHTSELQSL
jgi:hypothetical protein